GGADPDHREWRAPAGAGARHPGRAAGADRARHAQGRGRAQSRDRPPLHLRRDAARCRRPAGDRAFHRRRL
ncbi:MAG: Sulfur carrier protein ThiS, partial [uncultured Craurococcus sp.]